MVMNVLTILTIVGMVCILGTLIRRLLGPPPKARTPEHTPPWLMLAVWVVSLTVTVLLWGISAGHFWMALENPERSLMQSSFGNGFSDANAAVCFLALAVVASGLHLFISKEFF